MQPRQRPGKVHIEGSCAGSNINMNTLVLVAYCEPTYLCYLGV